MAKMSSSPMTAICSCSWAKRPTSGEQMMLSWCISPKYCRRNPSEANSTSQKFNKQVWILVYPWFIQFPRFTYIRIQGFTSFPYQLPIYPTNRMVLLEVIRQLETYQGFQRAKQKTAIPFPFFVEDMLESCPTAQATESAKLEMQWYPFTFYRSRANYDPHNNIGMVNGERYRHRIDLEDFWANAADEFDIKKRIWSRP